MTKDKQLVIRMKDHCKENLRQDAKAAKLSMAEYVVKKCNLDRKPLGGRVKG